MAENYFIKYNIVEKNIDEKELTYLTQPDTEKSLIFFFKKKFNNLNNKKINQIHF